MGRKPCTRPRVHGDVRPLQPFFHRHDHCCACQASLLAVHSASALARTGHSLLQSSESGPHGTGPMKLVYVLIFTVFFLSQVTPGCGYSDMHGFCDSWISVCLRRKRNCIFRMPGLCPWRSFCCIRVK